MKPEEIYETLERITELESNLKESDINGRILITIFHK